MKLIKKLVYIIFIMLLMLSMISPTFSGTRAQPHNTSLENIAILYLTISKYFFRSGEKFSCEAYVENRGADTLTGAKISLYIHKQGRRASYPAKVISQAIIPAGKITIFKFDVIWDETGYHSSYNYKHGDYKFETVVEYNNKSISKAHVLWAKPHEYMFYWSRPY